MGQCSTEFRSDFGSQSMAMMALKGQSTPLLSPELEIKLLKTRRFDSNGAPKVPFFVRVGGFRMGRVFLVGTLYLSWDALLKLGRST